MTSKAAPDRSLFGIRSGLAEDPICWHKAVIDHFDRAECTRPGLASVRLRNILVDIRVCREARDQRRSGANVKCGGSRVIQIKMVPEKRVLRSEESPRRHPGGVPSTLDEQAALGTTESRS